MATLSCAPLKNSDFLSMGMSSLALLAFRIQTIRCGETDFLIDSGHLRWRYRFDQARKKPAIAAKKANITGSRQKKMCRLEYCACARQLPLSIRQEKIEMARPFRSMIFPPRSEHDDIAHSLAGARRWRARRTSGHRRWCRAGARHGLFAGHGSTPGARNLPLHFVAADRAWRPYGILEARPGRSKSGDLVRAGNPSGRLCRKLDRSAHTFPEPERAVWKIGRASW